MKIFVYKNNRFVPLPNNEISIFDRGFLYGDGVFESLRTYNKIPFMLKEYLNRLSNASKILKITLPLSLNKLSQHIHSIVKKLKYREIYIKIVLTRGENIGHGLSTKKSSSPNLFLIFEEQKIAKAKIWTAVITSIKKSGIFAKIKSLSYLPNILAKLEAEEKKVDEGFFKDSKGKVIEGTISNLFIVKNGILFTPSTKSPILPGVTRKLVISIAKKLGIKIKYRAFTKKEIYNADECFVTFSSVGVVPVVKVDGRRIGNGKIGIMATRIKDVFENSTKYSGA